MPKNIAQNALIAAVALLALTLSGCAAPSDTATDTSSNAEDANGDVHGLNDDPELGDDSISVLGKYVVDGDTLEGDVPAEQQAVWDRFAELVPADMRPEVTLFVAIDAEKSGGTDGAMQINAERPEERYIALDVTGSVEPATLDRTMLHEFAHLLTLRDSQLDPNEDNADSCPVFASEKCPLDDSYLYAYLTEFWPDTQGTEFDSSLDAIADRYDDTVFVTEYAAKNPDEDLAEVFAEWMLEKSDPTGDSIVDQKLRFFDDYPELVSFRDEVAAVL